MREIWEYIKEHIKVFIGGAVGLIVGVLMLTLGFWATLLLVITTSLGALFIGKPEARDTARAWAGELETLFEMRDILKSDKFTPEQNEYINEIVKKFEENAIYIDSVISKYNKDGWKIDRIGRVDLSILRLALIEIFYMEDMPFKVTANEAVELAKKYSAEKSPSYINGVLASVARDFDVSGN